MRLRERNLLLPESLIAAGLCGSRESGPVVPFVHEAWAVDKGQLVYVVTVSDVWLGLSIVFTD